MIVINIDNNLSQDDYEYYYIEFGKYDNVIVNICDSKWRSCNKLLPTICKYPDAVIITFDDDVDYPLDCAELLYDKYLENQDCIICHQCNPILIKNGYISYGIIPYGYDIPLQQREFGKYLSTCCLFPPHVFDGSSLFDYDLMMNITNGTHDELWFWLNSTLNEVQCIAIGAYLWFDSNDDSGYALSIGNDTEHKMREYMDKINELYHDRLIDIFNRNQTHFVITYDNAVLIRHSLFWIYDIYVAMGLGDVSFDENIHHSWKENITCVINKYNQKYGLELI